MGARGEAGVYILDDLSTTQFTNQPIVTFMVNTVFVNPYDTKNSLRIKVKDEENNEAITELNPNGKGQTISISEGKNSYYFESSDGSSTTQTSDVKEINLDTVSPFIDISLPSETTIIPEMSNLHIAGIVSDDNLISISYRVNEQINYTQIPLSNLENNDENGQNGKILTLDLDSGLYGGNIEKIEF